MVTGAGGEGLDMINWTNLDASVSIRPSRTAGALPRLPPKQKESVEPRSGFVPPQCWFRALPRTHSEFGADANESSEIDSYQVQSRPQIMR